MNLVNNLKSYFRELKTDQLLKIYWEGLHIEETLQPIETKELNPEIKVILNESSSDSNPEEFDEFEMPSD